MSPGTGALKTDFTRTGKRSVKGTITDGVNSTKRFVNKNFKDEDKQLFLDIFLGRLQIERRMYENLRDSSPGTLNIAYS